MNKNITIEGISAYHSYPNDDKKHPGLIVIEEIWGVDAHIKDICDRFAKEGYSVISLELLPKGMLEMMTPQFKEELFDPEKRAAVQPKIREAMAPTQKPEYAEETIKKLKHCVDYLLAHEHTSGEIAVVGFCFGGTYAFHLAAHDERVKAIVPFYGHPPKDEEIKNISCPILALYGDQDAGLMETLPKLKETMEKENKKFEAIVYPNAGHAFFNDTNKRTYKEDVAKDAWARTLGFLKGHVSK